MGLGRSEALRGLFLATSVFPYFRLKRGLCDIKATLESIYIYIVQRRGFVRVCFISFVFLFVKNISSIFPKNTHVPFCIVGQGLGHSGWAVLGSHRMCGLQHRCIDLYWAHWKTQKPQTCIRAGGDYVPTPSILVPMPTTSWAIAVAGVDPPH